MDVYFGNPPDEEWFDETDQIKNIAKKTWLATATTSLANLEKVQTNVYNVGLADPKDLKATNLTTRRKSNQVSQGSELGTDRSSGQSSTLKAWGSNTSIPESIQQHGSTVFPKPTRPVSAKLSNNRVRPPSGRKPRPQSAKEPLPTGIVSQQAFGVRGAKYDPSGRPPKGVPNSSSMGWVGPPAGLKYPDRPPDGVAWQMDLQVESDDVTPEVTNQRGVTPEAPPPPNTSPIPTSPEPEERTKRVFELFIGDPYNVPQDAEMFDSSEDEDVLDIASPRGYSQLPVNHIDSHTYKNVNQNGSHAPEKESLRLSLPTADDEEEEEDEFDTERLLAEAEAVSSKFNLKSIISANKHIPENTFDTDNAEQVDSTNEKSFESDSTEQTVDCNGFEINNKKRAEELVTEIINENGLQFKKDKQVENNDILERDKSSVKFCEDVTTVNITPRNIGRKVEELHHNKKKHIHHTTDNFVDLIEIKNRVEPVLSTGRAEITEREVKSPPRGSNRPPSGKSVQTTQLSNKPVHHTPTSSKMSQPTSAKLTDSNRGKTVPNANTGKSKLSQAGPTTRTTGPPARPRSASAPLNRLAKPITTVTVDYGLAEKTDSEKSMNEKPKNENKRKERKRKDDVETMMQKIDFEGPGAMDKTTDEPKLADEVVGEAVIDILSAPTVCKSEHEKNYYEISRHSSASNISNIPINIQNERFVYDRPLSRENAVYKTTKTLEFDKGEPKEVSVKSVIDPHMVSTREKERFLASSPDIKHRKPPSRPSSAKPPVSKKPSATDDLERPGSRLGFVAMAPDESQGDKDENKSQTLNHSRPSSSSSYRRPRSAVKDKENKSQSKSKKTENKQKETTDNDKDEREKVIDNLLERTKCLVDDKKDETADEPTETRSPVVERKKRRPLSAHTGSLARLKEDTVKTFPLKRPTSAVTSIHKHYAAYSRTGSTPAPKVKKSTTTRKTRIVLTEPCIINTITPYFEEEETEEDIACERMERELAEKGLHISAATLQRALYPPSGRSKYYHISADLPKKSSLSLLSHPKVWLPEEHKRLQRAEKKLERANEIMYMQEKAEKRRAYLASLTPEQRKKLKKKGKKGGKRKSHSAVR